MIPYSALKFKLDFNDLSGRFRSPVILLIGLLIFAHLEPHRAYGQNYVFAQLNGNPVNTTGWNLQGAANANGSDIILIRNQNYLTGAIFYNEPINLFQCIIWNVEFDFRMYGSTGADGLIFSFLDLPPVGFQSGGSLVIPVSSNGLKVAFDTNRNCPGSNNEMPKIEIRWGVGYTECSTQPTRLNNRNICIDSLIYFRKGL